MKPWKIVGPLVARRAQSPARCLLDAQRRGGRSLGVAGAALARSALPRRGTARRRCLARSRAASVARGGSRVVVALRTVRSPSVLLAPVLRVPSAGQCRLRVVRRVSGGFPYYGYGVPYPYPYRYGYGYPYPYPYASYPSSYPYAYSGSAYPYPDYRPSANPPSTYPSTAPPAAQGSIGVAPGSSTRKLRWGQLRHYAEQRAGVRGRPVRRPRERFLTDITTADIGAGTSPRRDPTCRISDDDVRHGGDAGPGRPVSGNDATLIDAESAPGSG